MRRMMAGAVREHQATEHAARMKPLTCNKVLTTGARLANGRKHGRCSGGCLSSCSKSASKGDLVDQFNARHIGRGSAAKLRKQVIQSQAINKKAMLASCENAAAMDKPCKASMQRLLEAAKKSPSAKELVNTV